MRGLLRGEGVVGGCLRGGRLSPSCCSTQNIRWRGWGRPGRARHLRGNKGGLVTRGNKGKKGKWKNEKVGMDESKGKLSECKYYEWEYRNKGRERK